MSEPKHLVTLSDHNYLINGICLYESLCKYSANFVLHYLCLNDETYDKLTSLQLPNLKCYNITELHNDPDFNTLQQNNSSRPIDTSDGQSHFHWALASFFSGYLMFNYGLPHVLYIDSDIIFYDTVDKIFEAVHPKSIGIITHKHNKLDKANTNVGYYNVGVIYFKNDEVGSNCLSFWRNCCIHPNNKYSAIFGSCGDQKYLELFDDLFGAQHVEVLCRKVGNGAPWNFTMFEFIGNNKIIWHDKYIPDSKVHLYFSAADAIILSHKKISQSGIIPLAYHYDKLIIASNINSFTENIINTKTGYLFNNKDI